MVEEIRGGPGGERGEGEEDVSHGAIFGMYLCQKKGLGRGDVVIRCVNLQKL